MAITAAELSGRVQKTNVSPATSIKAAADAAGGCFWMKNPRTGYWAPENHFEEVDAAELRAKLLPKKSVACD